MNQKSVLLLTLSIGLGAILISFLSPRILEAIRSNIGSVNPRKVKLIVGVLSSLNRQDQRNAIRQSWKKLSVGPPHSSVFFVMPEKSCEIDPFWRIRESVCSEWRVRLLPYNDENASFRPLMVVTSSSRPSPSHDGIGFLVKFPFSIVQLGLSKQFSEQYFSVNPDVANVTVELFDVLSGDVLSAVNFSRQHLRSGEDGFLYLPIEEQMLPRHFEGVVRISKNNLM